MSARTRAPRAFLVLSFFAGGVLLGGLAAAATTPQKAPAAKPARAAPALPVRNIDARPWPREYMVDGVQFSLYRPQIDALTGNRLDARAVMAVKTGETRDKAGKTIATQDYGVVWLTARAETDKEAREVTLTDVALQKVNFPTAKDQEARYTGVARKALPTTELVASLDQIEASLAMQQAGRAAGAGQAVNNDPPEIIFSFKPAVLVMIDGDPVVRQTNVAGVDRVINSRALLLRHNGVWYLGHRGRWATAPDLREAWTAIATPPAPVSQAATRITAAQPGGKPPAAAPAPKDALPEIMVRTQPSELIVVGGEPQFADLTGTSLKYVTNTPADVILDGEGNWYALISGRWFVAPSTKGPWRNVAGWTLPADFRKIPGDSPKSAVLASIPGTPEAQESLVANAIPQTATVNRRQAKFDAKYDGAPQFRRLPGANLSFVANSPVPIFEVRGNYYALDNGVWFTGAAATGPWTAATSVPDEIYLIPSNSPLHYVTYVHIYGSKGDEIYVGYTPGYFGTVVSNNVVVYGAGYPCDSWVGEEWYGCPEPYGYGAAFGYSETVGWTFAFGWGYYDDYWYDPWWGPYGYWPYYGYYPPYYGGAVAGNVYGRWGNSVVAGTAAAWANPYTGNYGQAGRGGYYNTATGGRGYGYAGRNTNIYTGTSRAAAGGVRYNPQTGRVVAGSGASISNIYTGEGVAGGRRTTVNTETGRVTQSGGIATRSDAGATVAGGFSTNGGDTRGAGYVHYDRSTGDISRGGVVDVNGDIYAGKDGQVYKKTEDGWEQAGPKGEFKRAERPDSSLDTERLSRDRGYQRDRSSGGGFERSGSTRPSFDRGGYGGGSFGGGGYGGRMGGMRGGGGFRGGRR